MQCYITKHLAKLCYTSQEIPSILVTIKKVKAPKKDASRKEKSIETAIAFLFQGFNDTDIRGRD